jgi:hypothetical protein
MTLTGLKHGIREQGVTKEPTLTMTTTFVANAAVGSKTTSRRLAMRGSDRVAGLIDNDAPRL